MNAVEIAEAVAELVEQPFKPEGFPYSFLAAFDNPPATIERLKSGTTNNSDVGGVLQRNNIHILTCDMGRVGDALGKLRESAATTSQKAKFILATDGVDVEAEDIKSGETLACSYADLEEKFGFFLPLANITTVREIRESSFDIKATGRLNKLYVELLKNNPDWSATEKRHEMNHFMARLIFSFFAEDTGIFGGDDLLTSTVEKMSARDGSDVHIILDDIFKTMNTNYDEREKVGLPRWANVFPYVNGGLFSGSTEVPTFTKIARTYLLHIGKLDWKKINPDVFGSMIQAVANEEERSGLGMHYTSVPNILKVLNPLFLDDLRQQLADAENNARKLLNLRNRIKRIRVFDPACGSGNFLVIAYKEMRAIEAEVNKRRGESDRRSGIPITNFRGIELFDFPAEIARLALIIAEYQCDFLHIGQKEALDAFLPLDSKNWITCGNALSLDWLSVCPPTGKTVKHQADDLFASPLEQSQIDFDNEGGETYICGNPPFKGARRQEAQEKEDLERVFSGLTNKWKNVDYVGAWLMKAALFNDACDAPFAFVSTNSLCQGQQVPITWNLIQQRGFKIRFAHTSFKWSNLAAKVAGVTVVITGVDRKKGGQRWIFTDEQKREVRNINPYLTEHAITFVPAERKPRFTKLPMEYGVYYSKSAGLILSPDEKDSLMSEGLPRRFVRRFLGSTEYINGKERYCLWIADEEVEEASLYGGVRERLDSVKRDRLNTSDAAVNRLATKPHQFRERKGDETSKIFVPIVSSENREYLPVGVADNSVIPTNKAFFIPNGPLWAFAMIASKMHLAWISAICGRLEMRISYSNTLGWNTFPIPMLTEKNISDLERCAEDILLEREAHFPATIADLYDPEHMNTSLRAAHARNDEVVERMYIGRKFKNDTERLEKLFSMYTKMTTTIPPH